MEFANAIKLLAEAHENEVQSLREKIKDLEVDIEATTAAKGNLSKIRPLPANYEALHVGHNTPCLLPKEAGPMTNGNSSSGLPISSSTIFLEEDGAPVMGHELSVPEKWVVYSGRFLQKYDPKWLSVFPEHGKWKRWMLLSDSLLNFRTERRRGVTIRPRQIKIELLDVWVRRIPSMSFTKLNSFGDHLGHLLLNRESGRVDDLEIDSSLVQKCVIHPNSDKLFAWGLLTSLLVMYDVFMLPLDLSSLFTPPAPLTLVILMFWIADAVLTCLTGIETDDCVIDMRVSTIFRAYARSWLVPDLLVIFIDMLLLGIDVIANVDASAGGFAKALRANKMLRLIRLVRLFRLRKVSSMWRAFFTSVYGAYMIIFGNLIRHILVIFTLNHYIACMWFGIANWRKQRDEPTWLIELEPHMQSSAASYAYSLHWALTQVSPATQDIKPWNPYERTFALCVALFALVSFSWFVSQLTNSLNQLLRARRERENQELMLREFFRLRGISRDLGSRIMNFFDKNFEGLQARKKEHEIDFMADVPESMRLCLHEEMYMHILASHMFFFNYYDLQTRGTMLKICHTAMREMSVHPCQDAFIVGSGAKFVYCVIEGHMSYKQKDEVLDVEIGDWISEMAFWTKWEHTGTLTCVRAKSELSVIHLSTFQNIFTEGDVALHEKFRLLAIFAVQLVGLELPEEQKLSDLPLSQSMIEKICERAETFASIQTGLQHKMCESSSYLGNGTFNRVSLWPSFWQSFHGMQKRKTMMMRKTALSSSYLHFQHSFRTFQSTRGFPSVRQSNVRQSHLRQSNRARPYAQRRSE